MRDFLIAIFSPLLQLNVVVSTIGGFFLGGVIGGFGSIGFGSPTFNTTTAIVGAILAFSNAAIVSGASLALDQIRELLEEQNYLLRSQGRSDRSEGQSGSENIFRTVSSSRPQSTSQPTVSARKKRKCPDCGTETYDTDAFCPKCSARLTKTSEGGGHLFPPSG